MEAYLNERLGLRTYSPRIIEEKVMRGVMTEVARPLFPRYIFCQFDLSTQFQAVRQTPEVVDVVRCEKVPAVVSPALVAQLRNWAGEGVDVLNFQPGEQTTARVEITMGNLHVLPQSLLRSTNAKERVHMLLSLLENPVRATEVHPIEKLQASN